MFAVDCAFSVKNGSVESVVKVSGFGPLQIIDTPGICDPKRDEEEILHEIARCLTLCAPGPHALLFVISVAERFTKEEFEAYCALKAIFGCINNYTIVVATGVDRLTDDDTTLEGAFRRAEETIVEKAAPNLKKILKDVDNRYILFINRGDAATKDRQVLKLLSMVLHICGPKPYFKNDKTRDVWQKREAELQRIIEEGSIDGQEAFKELQRRLELGEKSGYSFLKRVVAGLGIGGLVAVAGAVVAAAPLVPTAAAGATLGAAGAAVSRRYCLVM